jgi:hypothetical protein
VGEPGPKDARSRCPARVRQELRRRTREETYALGGRKSRQWVERTCRLSVVRGNVSRHVGCTGKHGRDGAQGVFAMLHVMQPPGQGHTGVHGPLGQSGQVGQCGTFDGSSAFARSALAALRFAQCLQHDGGVRPASVGAVCSAGVLAVLRAAKTAWVGRLANTKATSPSRETRCSRFVAILKGNSTLGV